MKIFLYSTHLFYSPHIETELELMQKHLNQGDEVFRVICAGELSICDMNQRHELLTCMRCRDIRNFGKKLLDGTVINLPIITQVSGKQVFQPVKCRTVEDLKNIYYKNFDIGYAIASSLISICRESDINIEMHADTVDAYYSSSLKVYLSTIEYIEKYKPDVVYIFNSRIAHVRAVMRACEDQKIDFVVHERGCDKDRYELFYNTMPHSIKYQLSKIEEYWNKSEHLVEEKKQMATRFYSDRKNGNPGDWSSFTKEQTADLLPAGFDRTKKNIVIYNSSMYEYLAVSKEWNYPFYNNQEEFIANLLKMFEGDSNYHFYLRVHPNLKDSVSSQINRISALNFHNLSLISADSKVSSYHLLDNCDQIITFGSTMGIEATFWNKPSILVASSVYGDEAVYKASNYDEVYSVIKSNPLPKNKESAYKYGYYNMVFGMSYFHFKPETLFRGTYKGFDLMEAKSFLTKFVTRIYQTRFIGKPIDIYARLYKKYKLKLN